MWVGSELFNVIVHLFVIDCYYSIFNVALVCIVLGLTCCITYLLLLVVVFILLCDNYCNLNDFLSFLKFILQFSSISDEPVYLNL